MAIVDGQLRLDDELQRLLHRAVHERGGKPCRVLPPPPLSRRELVQLVAESVHPCARWALMVDDDSLAQGKASLAGR